MGKRRSEPPETRQEDHAKVQPDHRKSRREDRSKHRLDDHAKAGPEDRPKPLPEDHAKPRRRESGSARPAVREAGISGDGSFVDPLAAGLDFDPENEETGPLAGTSGEELFRESEAFDDAEGEVDSERGETGKGGDGEGDAWEAEPGEGERGESEAAERQLAVRTPGALVRLDPLSLYLADIRHYAPLERTEEVRLARKFRNTGDQEAAARLITANLILVVKIARLFRRAVVNVLDLIQEGNVGLLQALDRYDPEVGVRFSTYAAWWIKAYILKYLLDNVRMVRVGTTNARRKLLYNLHREKRRLESAGFSVGPRLLAEKFGVSERDVVDVERSLSGGDVSLDAPLGEESGHTRGDLFPAAGPSVEDEVARRELKDLIDRKLEVFRRELSEKEIAILDTRLLAETPATLQEIGTNFGITREAVRQAEKRLTERLRAYLTAELGEEAVLQFGSRRSHR